MNFTKEETEIANENTGAADKVCAYCGNTGLQVVPFFHDTVQRAGSVLNPQAVVVRLIMLLCEKCDHIEFFRGSVINKKEEKKAADSVNEEHGKTEEEK